MTCFLSRYDCTEHLLGNIDYCVHFMSRTPTIDPAKVIITIIIIIIIITMIKTQLEEMQQFVLDMELNAHNLEYKVGDQDGCW